MITYEIRERVETTKGNRMETIHTFPYNGGLKTGMLRYSEIVNSYPSKYFELVRVEVKETRLEFTKDR